MTAARRRRLVTLARDGAARHDHPRLRGTWTLVGGANDWEQALNQADDRARGGDDRPLVDLLLALVLIELEFAA